MSAPLKIAVLVSPATHPVTGRPLRSTADAAAFELACRLAPAEHLTVLCAGTDGTSELREYLGLGACQIEVLTLPSPGDLVPALVSRLKGFDVVLCGARAAGQEASGMLPYLLADGLGIAMIGDVLEATPQGRTLKVRQFMPKGMRRMLQVGAPVVLAVHPRAPQTRQFAYARAAAGRITHTGGRPGTLTASLQAWQFERITRRPQPLKAKVAQSGHNRMLGAIGGDSGARGGAIIKQGSADDKAKTLLAYLREHRLIDF